MPRPKQISATEWQAKVDQLLTLGETEFGFVFASSLDGDRHICPRCGLRFYPKIRRSKQRFCSDRCGNAAYQKRRRDALAH